MIDNYDSFTYNLVQAFAALGAVVDVVRNDAETADAALARAPTHLLISPGPGRPVPDSRISVPIIQAALEQGIPLFGVCLGMQALAEVCGGTIVAAKRLMHGKASAIRHDGEGLFTGIAQPMVVGRYHSLAVCHRSLPDILQVTATAGDGEIMGLRHRCAPAVAVQFHPESVLTPRGMALMENFLKLNLRVG